jgi:DNA/RNA-binding domain of Phe-tRNA-synthetase-like protein
MFEVTLTWKSTYPGAHAGVLVMRDVSNPSHHIELETRKAALEKELRTRFADQDRAALANHPVLQAYSEYYRSFKKTYHVQLQLESILWKNKSIPSGAALVESMLMAEIDDLLLTAGHDMDSLSLPLTLDVATGTETYTLLRGDPQTLKAGDMMIRDQEGVISSIIYGPDQRTQITPETKDAIFTVYAPAGVDEQAIRKHLDHIQENIRIFSPQAEMQRLDIYQGE